MKAYRTLLILFMIMLPITVVSLGANITARMPDVYQHEFKSTNGLTGLGLGKDSDEMGQFISDFMFGKSESFQIDVGDEKHEFVFKERELKAVSTARRYLNVTAVFGVVAAVITIAAIFVAKKNEEDKELRSYFKKSISFYILFTIIYVGMFFALFPMGRSPGEIFGYIPLEEDLLPLIFTKELLKKMCISSVVVCTVIYSLVGYVVYKLTEPKKIFSRTY